MLKSLLADVMQQLLHLRNLHNSGAAKRLQRIVGESSFADVASDASKCVVSREARKAHGTGFHLSNTSPKGVLLPHRSGNDRLEVHLHVAEEVLGKIRAMEADGLVGIRPVIVVPI